MDQIVSLWFYVIAAVVAFPVLYVFDLFFIKVPAFFCKQNFVPSTAIVQVATLWTSE